MSIDAIVERLRAVRQRDLDRRRSAARLGAQAAFLLVKSHYPTVDLKDVSSGVAADCPEEELHSFKAGVEEAAGEVVSKLSL